MFEELTRRLSKEMTPAELERLHQRDGDDPRCVLCAAGVPLPDLSLRKLRAYCYHHISERGMGGGNPNQLENLMPICDPHHQNNERYVANPELCQRAMVKMHKAATRDYPNLDPLLSPLVSECIGDFGYGTRYYPQEIVPEWVQRVFTRTSVLTCDFCVDCCPIARTCLDHTRAKHLGKGRS